MTVPPIAIHLRPRTLNESGIREVKRYSMDRYLLRIRFSCAEWGHVTVQVSISDRCSILCMYCKFESVASNVI